MFFFQLAAFCNDDVIANQSMDGCAMICVHCIAGGWGGGRGSRRALASLQFLEDQLIQRVLKGGGNSQSKS
jgi:hypothetical protein